MGIQDGNVSSSSTEENVSSSSTEADLVKKYCKLEKNGSYKNIDIKVVQEELKKTDDDDVIRQTFVLIALNYIVCPASSGKLGKKYLSYVENANKLHEQPWATLALKSLKNGIQTFIEGDLGGCVLFLQLYCMNKRMEELNFSEINDYVTKEFCNGWMIDHAPERKRKKMYSPKGIYEGVHGYGLSRCQSKVDIKS